MTDALVRLWDEIGNLQQKVNKLESERDAYKAFYEADKEIGRIYDRISPGLNTPLVGRWAKEYNDDMCAAQNKRKDALRCISFHRKDTE